MRWWPVYSGFRIKKHDANLSTFTLTPHVSHKLTLAPLWSTKILKNLKKWKPFLIQAKKSRQQDCISNSVKMFWNCTFMFEVEWVAISSVPKSHQVNGLKWICFYSSNFNMNSEDIFHIEHFNSSNDAHELYWFR